MNHKILLEYTVDILDTFNPGLEGVDEHAANYFDEHTVSGLYMLKIITGQILLPLHDIGSIEFLFV